MGNNEQKLNFILDNHPNLKSLILGTIDEKVEERTSEKIREYDGAIAELTVMISTLMGGTE